MPEPRTGADAADVKPIVIVKTGSALPGVLARHGDFEDWIRTGLGARCEVLTVSVFEGEELPDPRRLAGVVVTGSISMVTERAPWSERTAAWLAGAVEAERGPAILGICYGHQLLAHALGGSVGTNPRGREMGTKVVRFEEQDLASDPLLGGIALETDFNTSHLEAVTRLPAGARLLATTELDPNHVFRVGERTWGVQFHPEFDEFIMRGYVAERAEVLRGEGFDPAEIIEAVRPTPAAVPLLRRFAEIACAEQG